MPSALYLYSTAVSRGGRNSITHTSASPVRYVSPYSASCTYINFHDFAARPHAIFSTWQGTQYPDTKPTLPRAKNAYAPSQPATQRTDIYQLTIKLQLFSTSHQNSI